MAVYIRVIYLACLADNVGLPQTIPQRVLGAVFAYLYCLTVPQRF